MNCLFQHLGHKADDKVQLSVGAVPPNCEEANCGFALCQALLRGWRMRTGCSRARGPWAAQPWRVGAHSVRRAWPSGSAPLGPGLRTSRAETVSG